MASAEALASVLEAFDAPPPAATTPEPISEAEAPAAPPAVVAEASEVDSDAEAEAAPANDNAPPAPDAEAARREANQAKIAKALEVASAKRKWQAERKAQLEARGDVEARARAIAEREARLTAREQELAEALRSPMDGWKRLGLDPVKSYEEATRAILEQGTPEAKIAAYERRIAEMESRDRARAEASQREVAQARQSAGEKAFVELVEAKADAYPTLYAEHTPAELVHLAESALAEYVTRTGSPFNGTFEDIAEFLEAQSQERAKALEARRARTRLGSTAVATNGSGPPKTLTNDQASQGASRTAASPLSREDRRANIIATLEARDAREAASRR